METRSHTPNFTLSLRGYDRMEVDDYLDGLVDALGGVDAARAEADQMKAEISRLRSRVVELERCIRTETPRTGPALAEHIALILQEAEQAAAETVRRAEAESDEARRTAGLISADADQQAAFTVARAEEDARRIETEARARAAEIVADAEARAVVRTRQIEQWAEQVVTHTRAEQARMAAEKAVHRAAAEAQVAALVAKRETVAASLSKVHETLGEALGLIGSGDAVVTSPSAPDVARRDEGEIDAGDEAPELDKVIVIDDLDGADLEEIATGPSPTGSTPTGPSPTGPAPSGSTPSAGEAAAMVPEPAANAHPGTDDPAAARPGETREGVGGEVDIDQERPWPTAFNPFDDDAMYDLDAKYDAWEAADTQGEEGPGRHFKYRL
jgi:DivIVA domain-containing protein